MATEEAWRRKTFTGGGDWLTSDDEPDDWLELGLEQKTRACDEALRGLAAPIRQWRCDPGGTGDHL